MTANTITPDRISDLCVLLRTASNRMIHLRAEAEDGDISPAEAAAEINEIIANINAANK